MSLASEPPAAREPGGDGQPELAAIIGCECKRHQGFISRLAQPVAGVITFATTPWLRMSLVIRHESGYPLLSALAGTAMFVFVFLLVFLLEMATTIGI